MGLHEHLIDSNGASLYQVVQGNMGEFSGSKRRYFEQLMKQNHELHKRLGLLFFPFDPVGSLKSFERSHPCAPSAGGNLLQKGGSGGGMVPLGGGRGLETGAFLSGAQILTTFSAQIFATSFLSPGGQMQWGGDRFES